MIHPRDLLRRKARGKAPKEPTNNKLSSERSLSRLEMLLEFFTSLVVIGLIFEYAPDVLAAIKDHTLRPHIIGGVLVAIGVAGELFIGFRASRVDNKLRIINDSLVAAAAERAAEAEQAAAEANLARLKLEKQIANRDLSEEQRNTISKNLSGFAGQIISICAFPANFEAIWFAGEVARALTQAGWKTQQLTEPQLTFPGGVYSNGVSLLSTPDEQSIAAGLALLTELGAIAGGAVGPLPLLLNSENPQLLLVVQGRYAPLRTSVNIPG